MKNEMNIDKSWQAHNLQVGRIYVYAGTMETVRLVSIFPCEGVWLETFDGQSIDNGAGITIPFEDLLYASKDEVEDYLEDLREYRREKSEYQKKLSIPDTINISKKS